MRSLQPSLHRLVVLLAIACSSAAALIFEIALTRIFAVTQFYHFAFMAVSLALLGYGASGSVLTAFPRLGAGGPARWAALGLLQGLGTLGAYALANALPFDSYSIAWDARQVAYLALSYLALVAPFFFAGLVMGAILAQASLRGAILSEAQRSRRIATRQSLASEMQITSPAEQHGALAVPIASHHAYAANLIGSGAGCWLALMGLAWFGGVGVILIAALIALLAALGFHLASDRKSIGFAAITLACFGVFAWWIIQPPAWLDLHLSPYKDLSAALRYPGAQIVSTRWNASSRVDHVQSAGIRSLPGLSFTFRGSPPPQDGLTFDSDDLSPVPLIDPQQAAFVPYLLTSLPFDLRPAGDVLILEPRGGLEVFAAVAQRARSITAVEPNELAVAAAPQVYDDPRARLILDEPRAFVERSADQFDVIDLALAAPYRPVTSGAYSLAEDYRFTVEAFEQYLSRLKPDGILAVLRWLQTPPSEETRLIALAAEAVRGNGGNPAQSIVALRGYSTVLVLIKRAAFTPGELQAIRSFAGSRRFDLMAAPDLQPEESNRFNVLPDDEYARLARALLTTSDPVAVDAAYPFDITPPTDDHPFFGHFFKWSQAPDVLATLGKTWQPFGGAGYFVLIVLLGLSVVAALVLIVAPLIVPHSPVMSLRGAILRGAKRKRRIATKQSPPPTQEIALQRPVREAGARLATTLAMTCSRRWIIAYFGLLGIGFLFVEIPLIQYYILLVGRPTIAFAIVLFALLIASGLGSLASRRMSWLAGAIGLTIMIAAYPTLIHALTQAILLAPIEVRSIAGGLALLPLGFVMGTMFPKGIAYLEEGAPDWIPWAWGINGATSVISAIASALLALTFGFSIVIAGGAVCYGLCALLVSGTKRTAPRLCAINPPD